MMRVRTALTFAALAALLAACQTAPPVDPPPTSVFEDAVSLPVGTNAHALAAADLDGDGALDLAVVSSGTDRVVLLMGAGDGRFLTAPQALSTGPAPKHLVVVDVDGDGRLDIVVVNQDGHETPDDDVNVFVQLPGGFAPEPTHSMEACSRPHHVGAGDFDGDGLVDLAVACWGQDDIAIIPGAEDGFGPTRFVYSGGGAPHAVAVADFDGDGLDDVAVALLGWSAVSVLLSDGALGFSEPALYVGGSSHHSLAVADLNGDGHPDIVTANRGSDDVSVLLNDGSGGFRAAVTYSVGAGRAPVDVALGDVDGDGRIDIVTANSFRNHPPQSPPRDPVPTAVSVLFGGPGGGFFPAEHFDVDLTPFGVVLADLDGDDLLDVATANWHSHDVALLFNTGVKPAAGATRTTR